MIALRGELSACDDRHIRLERWLRSNEKIAGAYVQTLLRFKDDTSWSERFFQDMGDVFLSAARAFDDDRSLAGVVAFALGPGMASQRGGYVLKEYLMWAARWRQYGCPSVVLRPEQAATLAFTDISLEAGEDIVAPWPAFQVEIPDSELCLDVGRTYSMLVDGLDTPEHEDTIRRILVQSYRGGQYQCFGGAPFAEGSWAMRIPLNDGVEIHGGVKTIASLISGAEMPPWDAPNAAMETDDNEKRAMRMAERIALNTVLVCNSGGHGRVQQKKNGSAKWSARRLTKFHLDCPIVVGLTGALNEYIAGNGTARKARWVTRGHWARQAHGPRSSLRKRIWRHPHWNNRGGQEKAMNYTLGRP